MSRRRKVGPIAALSASFALLAFTTGCGSSGSSATQAQMTADGARNTYQRVLNLVVQGKYGDACDMYTAKERARVGDGNPAKCGPMLFAGAGLVGKEFLKTNAATLLKGAKVTIVGKTAKLTSADGKTVGELTFENGQWKVSKS